MNKPKDRPLVFLIIDDDKSYVDALYRNAQRLRILFKHYTNLEEAKQFIESKDANAVSGVVLDVKCMMKKQQEVAHSNFIMEAVTYFRKNRPHLPLAILTGEPDQYKNLKELFMETLNVYSKGSEEEQMLGYLYEQAQNLDYVKLAKQYPDVFDAVESYLDGEALEELISCFRNMYSSDFTTIKNSLACLRRLQEKVYIALNRMDSKIVPDELMKPDNFIGSKIQVREIYKHLTAQNYVKRYSMIDTFASAIYSITSDNGSHTPYENPDFRPTKYTVQSITFAMLDLLLWLKSTGDSKSEKA